MRVLVEGDNETARQVRFYVSQDKNLVLGTFLGSFTVKFEKSEPHYLTVDGVDSEVERLLVSDLAKSYPVTIIGKPSGTDAITIRVPDDERYHVTVALATYRALLSVARPAGFWGRLWRRLS